MTLFNRAQSSLANANAQQLVIAAAAGVGTLWIISKLLRELAHVLFPSTLPGEPNTALLATAKPNSKHAVSTTDLSNVREYDYIVVGTGTAGCVLANRLTEDPNVTVLAIESGHSDLKQIFSRIPAGFGRLFKGAADFDLRTTAQTECHDRKMQWPRGKMLGGCSAINAMIYNKGNPEDYDEWAKLGNEGWSYKELVPYMVKAEGFTQSKEHPLPAKDLAQHGRTGPWKVGYSYSMSQSQTFIEGMAATGIEPVTDFNTDRGMQGGSLFQTFIDNKGQRSSAAVAYLTEDVCRRPNLKIATGQTVTKILIEQSSGQPRAVGIEMSAGKASAVRYLVKAKREVLLCAGAVHSPQVLKLSGIGPADELKSHNIPLVKNLSGVGANLADHLMSTFVVKSKIPSMQYLTHPVRSLPALIEWLRFGTGAMTSNVADVGGFLRTADREDAPASLRSNDLTSGPKSVDLEILAAPIAYMDHGALLPESNEYFSIGPIMLRPESRGTIKLASSSPFDAPIIDANYLATKHDRDMMVYGMRLSRDIVNSKPMEKVFNGHYWPNKNASTATDEDLLDMVRARTETIYHPMCTAAMGSSPEKGAVVDARLRVHGVAGLRVVDASVFPTAVACHPCAPVIMTAEKAADLIKEDWASK